MNMQPNAQLISKSLRLLFYGLFGILLWSSAAVAEPLGDCSLEDGLSSRDDVIFCEPWEDPLWWNEHGFAATDRDPLDCATVNNAADRQQCIDTNTHPAIIHSSIVSEVSAAIPCVSGNCVKIDIPQGQAGLFSAKWLFRENTGEDPEQMYFRYYIQFGEAWNPAACTSGEVGGKLPGLSHTKTSADPFGKCGNGGDRPGGDSQCWSMRAMHKSCIDGGKNACDQNPAARVQYGSYLYFPDQYTFTGSNGMWHDGLNHWSSTGGSGGSCETNPNNVSCGRGDGGMMQTGRWYEVEMFVKMNTPGQDNGIIYGWVDGVQNYVKENMKFREAGNPEIHVREAWLNIFMGGSRGSCSDIEIYLDQMVLAKDARIGPGGLGPAPRPPANLSAP